MTAGGRTELTVAAGTEAGRRAENEDAFLAERPVFVVADGMGGHANGRAASAAVVEAFRPLVGREDVGADAVTAALARAGAAVERISSDAGAVAGATATGLVLVEVDGKAHWLAFNIGDSRTYRYADGRLTQLTVDHSVVQELVDAGSITKDAARDHPEGNVITRSISPGGGRPDYWLIPMTAGERLLLCSDGVTKELTDETIAGLLATRASAADAVSAVLGRVLEAGARDNATVVVVDVEGGDGGGVDDTVPRTRMTDDDVDRTAPRETVEEEQA